MKTTNRSKIWVATVTHALAIVAIPWMACSQTTIDFNDGQELGLVPINSFYLGRGVMFSNAVWFTPSVAPVPFGYWAEGTAGLGVEHGLFSPFGWAHPGLSSPIRIAFTGTVSTVSIVARGVGVEGARLRAFNATNILVGSTQFVGVAYGPGGTNGEPGTLLVTAENQDIRYILLDQPAFMPDFRDGVGWDTLTFSLSTNTSPPTNTTTLKCQMYAGVEIAGVIGHTYRIEYSPVLPSQDWKTLTNITLQSSPFLLFDVTSPGTRKRFYRAIELP